MGNNFLDKIYSLIRAIEENIINVVVNTYNTFLLLFSVFGFEIRDIIFGLIKFFGKLVEEKRRLSQKYYERNPKKWRKKRKKIAIRKLRIKRVKHKAMDIGDNISHDMAEIIIKIDHHNDKLTDKSVEKISRGQKRVNFLRRWAHKNSKNLLMGLSIVFLISVVSVIGFDMSTAYEYSYNGRVLGLVKRQDEVLKLMDLVSEKLSNEYGAEIKIDKEKDITFERVFALNKKTDSSEDVLRRLTYMKNLSARAYGIYIDGNRVAILDTREACEKLIDEVRNSFLSQSEKIKYERVELKEEIRIKEINTKLGKIENYDNVLTKIMTGGVDREIHIVVSGDTLSVIAKNYGISLRDLIDANPNINITTLHIGQEIILTKPKPMLTLQTVEISQYTEEIPFETEYEESSRIYKGETRIRVRGKNGVRDVVARITRENGKEVNLKVLSSTTTKKPKTQIVIKGTKPLPPLKGTGVLRMPMTRYKITSRYGRRWGSFHRGLDLAAPAGTRIGASDGGTVTFAGYRGSYGYCVQIDHGGNISTLYAHCSKLFVKRGDKVYQNQHIANVGSTGNSTGPHCHLEVRVNGRHQNPLSYVK